MGYGKIPTKCGNWNGKGGKFSQLRTCGDMSKCKSCVWPIKIDYIKNTVKLK